MLTTEQVKKIAEHIWKSVPHEVFEEHGYVIVETNLGTFDFDPIDDDTDAMMVFKALVDECKERGLEIEITLGIINIGPWCGVDHKILNVLYKGEFNNENICLAYLAVMESK